MITVGFVFETLTTVSVDLKNRWDKYVCDEYKDDSYNVDKLNHLDIAEISRFIVDKLKNDKVEDFGKFFECVEMLLGKADSNIENLLIVGLLEGIQNISGHEKIDYHNEFNRWLKPMTKKAWDELIYFWESDESIDKWNKLIANKK